MQDYDPLCCDIVAFIPTDRMEMLKYRLHKVLSPMVLAKLDLSNISMLNGYVSQAVVAEIHDLALRHPEFIDWLIEGDEAEFVLHKARKAAANALIDAMEMDPADSKEWAIKVKAAEAILKMKHENTPNKVSQTLKISALPSHMKSLAGKSVEDLEQELQRLKESQ